MGFETSEYDLDEAGVQDVVLAEVLVRGADRQVRKAVPVEIACRQGRTEVVLGKVVTRDPGPGQA